MNRSRDGTGHPIEAGFTEKFQSCLDGGNCLCSMDTRRIRPPRSFPFSAQRAAPAVRSYKRTYPKPPHRPVMTSVARLIDCTAPKSENNWSKRSTVMPGDRLRTISFVTKLFILPNSARERRCGIIVDLSTIHPIVTFRGSTWRQAPQTRRHSMVNADDLSANNLNPSAKAVSL